MSCIDPMYLIMIENKSSWTKQTVMRLGLREFFLAIVMYIYIYINTFVVMFPGACEPGNMTI